MVATLEDLYFVNDHIVEYTVHWGNEHASLVIHLIASVEDGKIVLVKPCQEANGAFASMACDCERQDGDSDGVVLRIVMETSWLGGEKELSGSSEI